MGSLAVAGLDFKDSWCLSKVRTTSSKLPTWIFYLIDAMASLENLLLKVYELLRLNKRNSAWVLTATRARQVRKVRVALALPLSISTGWVLLISVVQVCTFLCRHTPVWEQLHWYMLRGTPEGANHLWTMEMKDSACLCDLEFMFWSCLTFWQFFLWKNDWRL